MSVLNSVLAAAFICARRRAFSSSAKSFDPSAKTLPASFSAGVSTGMPVKLSAAVVRMSVFILPSCYLVCAPMTHVP